MDHCELHHREKGDGEFLESRADPTAFLLPANPLLSTMLRRLWACLSKMGVRKPPPTLHPLIASAGGFSFAKGSTAWAEVWIGKSRPSGNYDSLVKQLLFCNCRDEQAGLTGLDFLYQGI